MKKKGFTLVELLAVIVILGIILLITVPKITNTIDNSKESSLRSSAMMVASSIEKVYVNKQMLGEDTSSITCSDVAKLSTDDYDSCTVKIVGTKALINIVGKGKFAGKYICNGTRENATVTSEDCITYATSVIANSGNMTSDGTSDNNLRYSGATPNNYVTFNGEQWRIIGIFNVSNGTTTEQRIKIIRNVSIGNYSWDSSASDVNSGYGVNDWTLSDLKTELNTTYYNKTSGTCYNGQNNVSTTCDFNTTGLTTTAKSMIDNAVWNLGGTTYSNPSSAPYGLPTLDTYNKERGTEVYTGRPTTWTGIVGLLYPSDYGYASTDTECRTDLRVGISYTNSIWDYANAKCKSQDAGVEE